MLTASIIPFCSFFLDLMMLSAERGPTLLLRISLSLYLSLSLPPSLPLSAGQDGPSLPPFLYLLGMHLNKILDELRSWNDKNILGLQSVSISCPC